uniref:USP domain-containing protein n=1 Tax=Salix viminalis TaxID=40686 RepID=A0A6N2JWR3_SALVM
MEVEEDSCLCGNCGSFRTKKCSRCKSVRYCSQDAKKHIGRLATSGGIKSFSSIALAPACEVSNSKPIKKPGKVLSPYEEFIKLFNSDKPGFSPCGLLNYGNSCFANMEDAHEFMRFAIDTMQSVCLEFGEEKAIEPASQKTTIIQHIFGGRLRSQVICAKCNKISNHFENMMGLTVEIHGDVASLEECLDQFTDKEWLHGENMYKCDRCNNYVKAWKRLTIQRAPNVLTIALKSFQSGSEGGDDTDVYKLYAVVVHVDMLNASFFGHYICYTKDFHGNWHRIDDNKPHNSELSFSALDGDRLPRSNALYSTSYGDGVGASNIPYDPDVPRPGNRKKKKLSRK